eukprot:m.316150 g.316150  ORF g.316150 m.316150 type:complete len:68 (+) comp878288_c0_seq1:102-305(+)
MNSGRATSVWIKGNAYCQEIIDVTHTRKTAFNIVQYLQFQLLHGCSFLHLIYITNCKANLTVDISKN